MPPNPKDSPFTLIAADHMAKLIDEMVRDGKLDPRSPLADARLDYGQPWIYEHTPIGTKSLAQE